MARLVPGIQSSGAAIQGARRWMLTIDWRDKPGNDDAAMDQEVCGSATGAAAAGLALEVPRDTASR